MTSKNDFEYGESLVKKWIRTVNTHKVSSVMSLYRLDNCILIPTVSNTIFANENIKEYFNVFLRKKDLKGKLIDIMVQIACASDRASYICSGYYEFSFKEKIKNKYVKKVVVARFSYVFEYCRKHKKYHIINHHSSLLPEN